MGFNKNKFVPYFGVIPGWAETAPINSMYEALRGIAHEGGGATSQLDLPTLTT